ncbi:hypothetical protein D3C86_1802270 [compost metagenome]
MVILYVFWHGDGTEARDSNRMVEDESRHDRPCQGKPWADGIPVENHQAHRDHEGDDAQRPKNQVHKQALFLALCAMRKGPQRLLGPMGYEDFWGNRVGQAPR